MKKEYLNQVATRDSLAIQNIREKKRLLDLGDSGHKRIVVGIIIDSGGMLGIYGGGWVTGLQELGYCDVADHAIGISAGAADKAYFYLGRVD